MENVASAAVCLETKSKKYTSFLASLFIAHPPTKWVDLQGTHLPRNETVAAAAAAAAKSITYPSIGRGDPARLWRPPMSTFFF